MENNTNKKDGKKNKTLKTILIIVGILAGLVVLYFVALIVFVIVAFVAPMVTEKVEVNEDISLYCNYISKDPDNDSKYTFDFCEIFPESISSDMNVKDYKYVYYNPFDAQYISYLDVEYTSDASYEAEISRLKALGVEDYTGIYSVTDEPAGYDLIAMDSDIYSGFVYAMVPENSQDKRIVYVGITFCNYFLDLDIHEYVPDEYLLTGFDATKDNPYRNSRMKNPEE